MKEAAIRGGLPSFFATDILYGVVEALDEIVDPLVLDQIFQRAV